jgi:hypothetical protein
MDPSEIPSPCLEEARQLIAAHAEVTEADAGYDAAKTACLEVALDRALDELADRYGVDARALRDAVSEPDPIVIDVAGDAQQRTPREPRVTEFGHGGRTYRVTRTDTRYPLLHVRSQLGTGRWVEVDPASDMALYDAFIGAAESIDALDDPGDDTLPDALMYADPLDPDVGGGP